MKHVSLKMDFNPSGQMMNDSNQSIISFSSPCVSSAVSVQSVFVEPPQPVTSLRSMTETQTRLPCRYQVQLGEKVVQVTWYKELPGGNKEQIITAHFRDGHTGKLLSVLTVSLAALQVYFNLNARLWASLT